MNISLEVSRGASRDLSLKEISRFFFFFFFVFTGDGGEEVSKEMFIIGGAWPGLGFGIGFLSYWSEKQELELRIPGVGAP